MSRSAVGVIPENSKKSVFVPRYATHRSIQHGVDKMHPLTLCVKMILPARTTDMTAN